MRLLARLWVLLAVALLTATGAAAQTFPPFTGLVVDAANVLPPATRADLTAKLEALQRDTNRQLVVATIPDLQGYPLEDYGYRLLRTWGVGLKDVNNGAILFIAPNEPAGHRGPRVEVGYGLEPILTDAFSSVVVNTQMLPRLKAGDIPGAVTAGTDALITQLRASPDEAKAHTDAAVAQFDRTHRRSTRGSGGVPVAGLFWLVILFFVVLPMLRGRRRHGPWGQRYSSGGSMWPIVLWGMANSGRGGGWGGGGGSWSGGGDGLGGGGSGGSDGGWGGGGFTGGGGGSGGGGGASGSW